jgi:probable DNA metabolism protein
MKYVCYDGSYEGLLTSIFEVYEYKIDNPWITAIEKMPASLFAENHHVHTDTSKAERVFKRLQQKLSADGIRNFLAVYLSEIDNSENILLRFAQNIFHSQVTIERNYSNSDVLAVQQISRKVFREKHRMEAFIRFKRTADDLYYAVIEPDYNVVPLIISHFQNRYADQYWLIYDAKRKYAVYYDLKNVTVVSVNHHEIISNYASGGDSDVIHNQQEFFFENLWKQYFKSVNIAARKNTKLHVQHMPKRYWKYLTEKK